MRPSDAIDVISSFDAPVSYAIVNAATFSL
jgi:hypothetical protein